jgi:sugar lactone lactonase YvrE
MPEPEILLSGLGIPESPRWHEGRLWFCNWIDRQVVAVDMDGQAEVMLTRDPASYPMGYSIDWLPDGRLLTTGDKVRRQEPDGSMAVHAGQPANEIVVDARGHAYVNGADFDFVAGAPPKPGYIKLVTPDGHVRQVADDIQFPNGMVITPDGRTLIISESFAGRLTAFDIDADGGLSGRRVFAEGLAPDGICMDAEGAVWVGTAGFSVARVAEGGQVRQRVELGENRASFAMMLGGPDRRTLFICTVEWRQADDHVANLERLATGPRTGKILALPVEVPGTGRPLAIYFDLSCELGGGRCVAVVAVVAESGERLPGCGVERFGMGPAVVLGQDLTEVAGPVRDGALADLAAGDR